MLSHCRLCRSEDLKLYYTQGHADQYRFYRCTNCTLVNYDLSTGLYQEKYAGAYADPRDHNHRHNTGQTETYNFLKRHIHPPGRLLDVGCGNGRLLFLAREGGWSVKGLELSDTLANSTRRATGIDIEICDFSEYRIPKDELFDVLVLRHVLEHLPDPICVMNRVHALLKIDGWALLEFPNIEAVDLKLKRFMRGIGIHRKRYSPDYRPAHCNEFCRDSFEFLLEKTGFRLERWSTYSSKPYLRRLNLGRGTKARVWIRKRGDIGRSSHRLELRAQGTPGNGRRRVCGG